MSDTEIRVAIAEILGIEVTGIEDGVPYMHRPYDSARGGLQPSNQPVPNYPGDLNAMHEAEKTLKNNSSFQIGCQGMYINILNDMCGSHFFPTIHATAHQRAEAFLRAFGKWRE